MKKVIVVFYRAFDRAYDKTFIGKTYYEIHTELNDICSTYVVTCIWETTKFINAPLSNLALFQQTTKQTDSE